MSERPDTELPAADKALLDRWTIDPRHPTNFQRTSRQLQAFWLLCMCVAGKGAMQQALKLGNMLRGCPQAPFLWFRARQVSHDLLRLLQEHSLGNYTRLDAAIWHSVRLHESGRFIGATEAELLAIPGVGIKTARMFQLHSRPRQRLAVLDTHVLAWMRANGVSDAPEKAPPKHDVTAYDHWQAVCLGLMSEVFPRLSAAEADIAVWRSRAVRL